MSLSAQEHPPGGLGFESIADRRPLGHIYAVIPSEGTLKLPGHFTLSAEIELVPRWTWGEVMQLTSPSFSLYLTVLHHHNTDSTSLELSLNGKSLRALRVPTSLFQRNTWYPLQIRFDAGQMVVLWNGSVWSRASVVLPPTVLLAVRLGGTIAYRHGFDGGVRNLRISTVAATGRDEVLHHWPMDERSGPRIPSAIGDRDGFQQHATWLASEHEEWQLLTSFHAGVDQEPVLDSRQGTVMLAAKDSLILIECNRNRVRAEKYRGRRPSYGMSTYFDPDRRQLMAYHSGAEGEITFYDRQTRSWSPIDERRDHEQHFYFNTRLTPFPAERPTSFGGYGWYEYRRDVRTYDVRTKQWMSIPMGGDSIEPRWKAVLAYAESPGRYLLFGGQGIASGRQADGRRPLPQMFRVDVSTRTMTRLWTLADSTLATDGAGAPSLDGRLFYFLEGNADFLAKRGVMAGRVDTPAVWNIGGPIDLAGTQSWILNRDNKELIVVAYGDLERPWNLNELSGTVRIYRLRLPARPTAASLASSEPVEYATAIVAGLLATVVLFAGAYVVRSRRNGKRTALSQRVDEVVASVSQADASVRLKNHALLFGGFDLFDREGRELRPHFSPQLRELFLVLLLRSRPCLAVKGIDRHELSSIFWPSYDEKSSKNNRGVAIARLRSLIEGVDGLTVDHEGELWLVRTEAPFECDLFHFDLLLRTFAESPRWTDPEWVRSVTAITGRGRLLEGLSYEWLDGVRTDLEITVVRVLQDLLRNAPPSAPADLRRDVASALLVHEPSNLHAVEVKLQSLLDDDQRANARQLADEFRRRYEAEHGRPFSGVFPGNL